MIKNCCACVNGSVTDPSAAAVVSVFACLAKRIATLAVRKIPKRKPIGIKIEIFSRNPRQPGYRFRSESSSTAPTSVISGATKTKTSAP